MIFCNQVNLRTDQHIILNCYPTHIQERTGMVDKYVFSKGDEPAEIGIKGRKHRCAVINMATGNFNKYLA